MVSSGRIRGEDEGDESEEEREACSVTATGELRVKVQHPNCRSHSINGSELSCVYFNAQSIMNKLDDLHTMICSLQPDIVGISESWTNCNISDSELSISGYETFRCDRPNLHRGGGVLLYIRSELQPIQHFPTSSFPEQVWCKLRNKNKDEILIGVCYRTPTSSIYRENINTSLRELLNELSGKHFVLMGDFNYPGIDWEAKQCLPTASKETQLFWNCCEDNFLVQHVTVETRLSSILDLVISDTPEVVDNVHLLGKFADSDHSMLCWNINYQYSNCVNNQQERTGTFDYAKGNFTAIRQELSTVNWTELLQPLSVEECWKAFKEVINRLEVRHIPVKKFSKKKMQKPVWMSYKAMKLVTRKHRVYKRYKSVHHPAYVKATKEAKKEIKKAKKRFESKLAQNIKNDKKSFYAYVRSKSKSKTKIGPLAGDDGATVEDSSAMAESFNTFFSSVFTVEDMDNMPRADNVFSGGTDEALQDIIVNDKMIVDKLTKLRSDKAAGADAMSPWLLKEVCDLLVTPISILLRKSLDEGVVPEDWKLANVCPIFKKGVKSQVSNYRPVSLTSQVSKVIESVLRDAIVSHLESNQLIRDSQHGFRKGRSCLTNLLVFLDKVTGYIDEGYMVDVIYLDFAKAFDKVPHQRLLDKLKGHGIHGKVFNWIEAWLTNRQQRVCIQGKFSTWTAVTSGVPQGSVLGPVLFLIFINDLDKDLESCVLKFADDTKLFRGITETQDNVTLQKDLVVLQRWSENWQMQFNVDKCKVMHIGKHNPEFKYTMANTQLETVHEEKDLGVIISEDLKPSAHCIHSYTKANRMLGLVKRTLSSQQQSILLRLYKSLVRPHLEYCSPAWSPKYVKDRELLERVQHRFTRFFKELRQLDYTERLRRLGLWSLEERRNRADLIEVYKMVNGLSALPASTFFEFRTDNRTRGHSVKIIKQRSLKDLRLHFFSERVVNRWNKLPASVLEATSVNSFKSQLQKVRTTEIGFFMDTSSV